MLGCPLAAKEACLLGDVGAGAVAGRGTSCAACRYPRGGCGRRIRRLSVACGGSSVRPTSLWLPTLEAWQELSRTELFDQDSARDGKAFSRIASKEVRELSTCGRNAEGPGACTRGGVERAW